MTGNTPVNLLKTIDSMVSARKSEIAMDLQKVNHIDEKHARVLVSINPVFHNRLTDENMAVAVASKLNGVRYLPGSVHRMSGRDKSLLGIFVSKNNQTMSMEQASASGMSQVSDTVFQDANDDIWTVIKNGDTAYLVKQADEDVNSLLSAVRSRSIATASVEVAMSEDFGPGMPLRFYDFDKEEMAFAVAVDGSSGYVPQQDVIKAIPSDTVVGVSDEVVEVSDKEIAASSSDGKADILEFMRMLYSHNKEFLSEINDIIRNHTHV